MRLRHIMVDLETMGTCSTSAIIAIGAVEFDPFSDRLGDTFYQVVDLNSSLDFGLTADASTILWWMAQSQQAREAITGVEDPALLNRALDAFSEFVSALSDESWSADRIRLWCHGPSFDAVVLENAYRACGFVVPWKYNSPRDTRTLIEAADMDTTTVKFDGTQHNAMHDALHQARVVQAAYRKLRAVPPPIEPGFKVPIADVGWHDPHAFDVVSG